MGQETLDSTPATPAIIDTEKCSGCGRCVAACPEKLYTLQVTGYRKASVNKNLAQCSLCKKCLPACPLDIIR